MNDQPLPLISLKPAPERIFERWLFRSRWLLAPMYVGLVLAMAILVIVFGEEVVRELGELTRGMNEREGIVMALSLVDLSLTANLMLIVIFSGYENFVSRVDSREGGPDRPTWMSAIDFSGLKLRLVASIIAISAVALLRGFMRMAEGDPRLDDRTLMWLVALHLVFLLSGLMLALMDRLGARPNG